jgi:hypothetical protein
MVGVTAVILLMLLVQAKLGAPLLLAALVFLVRLEKYRSLRWAVLGLGWVLVGLQVLPTVAS